MSEMSEITRKKHTGEPGNGGQFGHADHTETDVTLVGFTSGTQARDGRTVYHDPKPYIGVWEDGERYKTDSWAHYRPYRPRPEFTVRDNPIIARFREYAAGDPVSSTIVHNVLDDLSGHQISYAGADLMQDGYEQATQEDVSRAVRVLSKLALLTDADD